MSRQPMVDVLSAVNKSITKTLEKKRSIEFEEGVVDVDAHDDSLAETKKDLEVLRSIREMVEERVG